MSALAIDSQVEFTAAPVRVAPTRPTGAPQARRAGTLPRFSQVVPLRASAPRGCTVSAPAASLDGVGEWHWTPLAMSLGVALMSITAVVGMIAVVVAFLAIPN